MKSVLIIDDDPVQIAALTRTLADRYRVFTALDAKIGWNSILKKSPDLILLDIMLPGGMNGFELLDQLRRDSKHKDTPVIVLTNLDSEENAARAIGVTDYLVKANTSIEDIANKVRDVLSR